MGTGSGDMSLVHGLATYFDAAVELLVRETGAVSACAVMRQPNGDWRIISSASRAATPAREESVGFVLTEDYVRTALVEADPLADGTWVPSALPGRGGWLAGTLTGITGRITAALTARFDTRCEATATGVPIVRQTVAALQRTMTNAQRNLVLGQLSSLRHRELLNRERHDAILQNLFGIALGLEVGVGALEVGDAAQARLTESVDRLYEVLQELQASLGAQRTHHDDNPVQGPHLELERMVVEIAPSFGFLPTLDIECDRPLRADISRLVVHVVSTSLSTLVGQHPTSITAGVRSTGDAVVVALAHEGGPAASLHGIEVPTDDVAVEYTHRAGPVMLHTWQLTGPPRDPIAAAG